MSREWLEGMDDELRAYVEQREHQRQESWESQVWKKLYQHYGQPCKRDCPPFDQRYPDFPVRLVPHKLPNVHEITIENLFGRPLKTGPVKQYLDLLDEASEDLDPRDVAMIFNWPDLGTMCLTTYALDIEAVRCFCSGLSARAGRCIKLVSLKDLLGQLNWDPGDYE